ncbi:hypothetical protein ANN_09674 [Periplaneta americana]|uniref:Uncharacterized protein n=1 Tax=Periplaneta americana TaxID=6978 RepID=A0ABQ8TNP5_PERAM|nr:hypothetical protein ANN_09674 [Periplaneta americana]
MVTAGQEVKTKHTNIIHVTFFAHACHRISEEVRSHFPDVDQLISNVKKVFVKSPSSVSSFKKQCPGVPVPPSAMGFLIGNVQCSYCDNFAYLQKVIKSFNSDDAV